MYMMVFGMIMVVVYQTKVFFHGVNGC